MSGSIPVGGIPSSIGDLIFHAPFTTDFNAIVGAAPTGTPGGNAAIVSGKLDLTSGGYVTFPAANLALLGAVGEIQITLETGYSGNPPGDAQYWVGWGNGNNNYTLLGHNSQVTPHTLQSVFNEADGDAILSELEGDFDPTAGTPYTLKYPFDFTDADELNIFNGAVKIATVAGSGVRSNDTGLLVIGSDPALGTVANFKVSNVKIFKAIQTT